MWREIQKIRCMVQIVVPTTYERCRGGGGGEGDGATERLSEPNEGAILTRPLSTWNSFGDWTGYYTGILPQG